MNRLARADDEGAVLLIAEFEAGGNSQELVNGGGQIDGLNRTGCGPGGEAV